METKESQSIKLSNGVEKKIQSLCGVKKWILEPTEELLQSPSDNENLRYILRIYLYLDYNKRKVKTLKEALERNRCSNQTIKDEVEYIIKKLQKNIPLLQEKMDIYRNSILKKNADLELLAIKKHFKDEKDFVDFMRDITLLYEDPGNDAIYGNFLRRILVELEKCKCPNQLNQLEEECKMKLSALQGLLALSNDLGDSSLQRDLRQASISLAKLIKLCDIISDSTYK